MIFHSSREIDVLGTSQVIHSATPIIVVHLCKLWLLLYRICEARPNDDVLQAKKGLQHDVYCPCRHETNGKRNEL